MRNLLQDQLLKAGLVKKQQVDAAARAQTRQREGKAPAPPPGERVDAQKLAAEKAERDRALAAERNAEARARELQAQVRQIIEQQQVRPSGEIDYRFVDGSAIRSVRVDEATRTQLARGALVIARHNEGYAILPAAAGSTIVERGGCVVVDHARPLPAPATPDSDEAYYARFQVPDDLVW